MTHLKHLTERHEMRQGIRWVMEYYYRGVVSWDWFYPHHYAPMISDMTGLAQIRVGL